MIKKLIVVIPMFLVVIKANSQNVGINDNGNNPNPSAMLDIDSQSKGLLIPRLTTIERDAINNPVEALMIYNKDTECYEGYNANIQKWQSFGCIDCQLPNVSVATAGTNINTISFDANWNASANATTYYIDVSDDAGFSNLIINNLNVGNVLTYNVSGLTCNIDYYYRVRAENACGTTGSSNVEMLTTAFCWSYALCGGGIMTFNDVTNPNTGKTWMDRNLGASQVAASSTDANSYGDLFQWGREADGHQCRNSSTTSTRSSSDSPGHGNFITNSLSPYDWRTQQNNNLWQGVNGTNNPCPFGYRLPTETELDTELQSWSSQDASGAFNSILKLPMGGHRRYSDGALRSVDSYGRYWSSTVYGIYARMLGFSSSSANVVEESNRAHGRSVRYIKN